MDLFIVSDKYGYVYSSQTIEDVNLFTKQYPKINFLTQKFKWIQKPEDQKLEDQKPEDQKPEDQKPEDQKPFIWIVVLNNNYIVYASNCRDDAIKVQYQFVRAELSPPDNIDFWKYPINLINQLSIKRYNFVPNPNFDENEYLKLIDKLHDEEIENYLKTNEKHNINDFLENNSEILE